MWAQIINAILGLWLMAAPAVLGYSNQTTTADNAHIVGPVIVSFAVISWWEATRVVRLYNVPLGLWLLLAPWILNHESTAAIINDSIVGLLVLGLSFVQGKIESTYGGGWAATWRKDTLHAREARKKPRTDFES